MAVNLLLLRLNSPHCPGITYSSSTTTHFPSPTLYFPRNLTQHGSFPNQVSQTLETEIDEQNPFQVAKSKISLQSRLSQLCKDGRPDLARGLFDSLIRPNTVLWNTIIIGFICNGMPEEAIKFYQRMKKYGVKSDFYSYSSALKACADTQNIRFGKAVHCQVVRSCVKPSRVLNNSLLNMYSSCLRSSFDSNVKNSNFDIVRYLFDRMHKRSAVSWNTVIEWYEKTGRSMDAVMLFKIMMERGFKPTVISFVNVFPALASIQDWNNSRVIYGMLLKLGSDYANDLFAVSSAIYMFSELSDISSARRVFDCSLLRNTEVWNTLIGCYAQNCYPHEALNVFLEILNQDNIFPDAITFLSALMAVSQLQTLDVGCQIHAYLLKSLSVLPLNLSNALIAMYSKCNSIRDALKLFNKMPEKDLVSWNTMISSFVQNGNDVEGILLTRELLKHGFLLDSVTATSLLSAASNLGDLMIGKQTHAYLFRHGIQFEGMESYLIDMYAKSGLIEVAHKLFDRVPLLERDQVTWNAMIAGYTQNGQSKQSLAVFRQMLEQNQLPNSVTLASILPACNQIGGTNLGKQIHAFALRCNITNDNVFVGTSLIDVYSKCGLIKHAERVFQRMTERNSVTYTTMISGFGQHGLGERALNLFNTMQESGTNPDSVTFVAILSACSYSGLVEDGLKIYELMETEYGIQATSEHYGCVVDMLGRFGRVADAFNFVKNLGEQGNFVRIWGSLLGACRVHGEYELGKLVADKLFELEEGNCSASYHVLISNIYAAQGEWASVDRLRKGMRQKGLMKQAGCSWIELKGRVNSFMSRDQVHLESDKIYKLLENLVQLMKLEGYKPVIDSSVDNNITDSEDWVGSV